MVHCCIYTTAEFVTKKKLSSFFVCAVFFLLFPMLKSENLNCFDGVHDVIVFIVGRDEALQKKTTEVFIKSVMKLN